MKKLNGLIENAETQNFLMSINLFFYHNVLHKIFFINYYKLLFVIVTFLLLVANIRGDSKYQQATDKSAVSEDKHVLTNDDNDDRISEIWHNDISPRIKSIDITSANSIYGAQVDLMFVVYGVYVLNRVNEQEELVSGINAILKKLPWIKRLRMDATNLDPWLADLNKSGPMNRRVFPTKDAKGVIYYDSLSTFQFCYLLSHLAKTIVGSKQQNQRSSSEQEFLKEVIPFLCDEIVIPLYTDIEAIWYSDSGGNCKNMKELIYKKINYKKYTKMKKKSYFRAISDQELFMFGIASDLIYIDNKMKTFSTEQRSTLNDVIATCYKVMKNRLSQEGFLFDIGVWDDHPDHAYAGYYGPSPLPAPDPKDPDKYKLENQTADSSHSHRLSWWFTSYRDAYPSGCEQYTYYTDALKRLAAHFTRRILTDFPPLKNQRPRLQNYTNGNNGWYCPQSISYPPNELSSTAEYGSWNILALYDDDVRIFNRAMRAWIQSGSDLMRMGTDDLADNNVFIDPAQCAIDPFNVSQETTNCPKDDDNKLSISSDAGSSKLLSRSSNLSDKGTRFELYSIFSEKIGLN